MERQKQSVIDGSDRNANDGSGTASGRASAARDGEARNPASTTQPRDSGHYICSCDDGHTALDIPRELQLFAAGRQSRNLLWTGSVFEGAAPGARGLSVEMAERPPPGL